MAMTSEINDPLTIKRNYRKSLECTNLDYVPDIDTLQKNSYFLGGLVPTYIPYIMFAMSRVAMKTKFKFQRWKK